MPYINHQNVEDILKAASPEQKILWNDLFLRFGERISISMLTYTGTLATSEISVYNARKIYLAYNLIASTTNSAAAGNIRLYNEANAEMLRLYNQIVTWDTVATTVLALINSIHTKNVWFSRLAFTQYETLSFIGFRIGI